MPSSTRVSQVPQTPSQHEYWTATPASIKTSRIDFSGGTAKVTPLCASFSSNEPLAAASVGRRGSRTRLEPLDVDRAGLAPGRGLLERFHERGRTAAIEVRVGRRIADDSFQIDGGTARNPVENRNDRTGQGLQLVEKRGAFRRPCAQVERPRPPERAQTSGHGQQRRDTDSAGHENRMRRRLVELEVVARRADVQDVADLQLVMQIGRSAACVRVAPDRDDVAMVLGRVVAQRVLPHDEVAMGIANGQLDVDVRARREARKLIAIGRPQLDRDDALGDCATIVHPNVQAGCRGRAKRRGHAIEL